MPGMARSGWGRRRMGRGRTRPAGRPGHPGSVVSSRARAGVVLVIVALGFAASAPQALADFPYIGDGTPSEPASWKLAAGHVPTNVGGLAWKFAATPAIPPSKESNPTEYQAVTQNNSQIDELCGVTGMSLGG